MLGRASRDLAVGRARWHEHEQEQPVTPSVTRTLSTPADPDAVFDFLLDFTTTEQWDPGTQTCRRVSGNGGVGTVYDNVSTFLGRTSQVTYVTLEAERPSRLHFRGTNDDFEGHDVLGMRALPGGGTELRYHAEFSFRSALVAPVVAAHLPILATRTMRQLQGCLDRLARA